MALSNWDTWAINQNNKSLGGRFQSELGFNVDIYKNWLYIYDAKSWQEKSGYTEPCVMEIWQGEFRYKETSILAARGPKNGIYCIVWSRPYGESKKNFHLMAGIGCYGYKKSDWVGVENREIEYLKNWLNKIEDEYCYLPIGIKKYIEQLDLRIGKRFNQGDMFFANQLGFDCPDSDVGQAKPTILSQVLKNEKGE